MGAIPQPVRPFSPNTTFTAGLVYGGGATQPAKKAAQVGGPNGVYQAYFAVQRALARDEHNKATDGYKHLAKLLTKEPNGMLDDVRAKWHVAQEACKAGTEAGAIEQSREAFRRLSNAVLLIHGALGHDGPEPFYRVHCPMAFGEGADWMQDHNTVDNPYYGSSMLRCGSIKKKLPGRAKDKDR